MTDLSRKPTTLYVIDNDEATVQQIQSVLSTNEINVQPFESLVTFLNWLNYDKLQPDTLVACEIELPDLGGPDLLNILYADEVTIPTILMGRAISVANAVDAMHAGANYILQKPFSAAEFRKATYRAMKRSSRVGRVERNISTAAGPVRKRLSSLSERQRQMLIHVFEGRTNKQIARHLSISPKTVELHRSAMMEKMGAATLAELIRLAARCDDFLRQASEQEVVQSSNTATDDCQHVR